MVSPGMCRGEGRGGGVGVSEAEEEEEGREGAEVHGGRAVKSVGQLEWMVCS